MSNATDIMNKAIEFAIENGKDKEQRLCEERGWDYQGGVAPAGSHVETDHGTVTCMLTPCQSRTNPSKPISFKKQWRLDGKVISAEKIRALLDS